MHVGTPDDVIASLRADSTLDRVTDLVFQVHSVDPLPTAWETAKEIRARIYDEIRLTASAGISCNKFLAKIQLLADALLPALPSLSSL
jgi:nucleotidyltransferase/DNA polymerase involved in DNA repair